MDGKEALDRLMDGNVQYRQAESAVMEISAKIRGRLLKYGQSPLAVVISCSDSRVIPEAIFSAKMGELFVIREAGNVIGAQELGSIEYAVLHLGISCVIVLGHDHCGAVAEALKGANGGFVGTLTEDIRESLETETDQEKASRGNVKRQIRKLLDAKDDLKPKDRRLYIVGGLYHQSSGEVEILEQYTIG